MSARISAKAAFRLVLLLLLLFCFSTGSFAQSKKQTDIKELMGLMYGDQLLEGVIAAMTEAMSMEEGPMRREVIDSIRELMIENVGSLQDSIAGVFDRLYTAEEISEMIKMYQTPIGKRLAETQTELLQMSMAAGRGWANSHADDIEARIKPIIEKYQAAEDAARFNDNTDDPLAYDSSLPELRNHPKNNKTAKGSTFKYGIQYNSSEWKPTPPKELNDMAELALLHIDDELFCVLIAEEADLSLKQLRGAAMINMRKVANQVEVKNSRLRKVNGTEVLELLIDCEIDGISASYHNLYFSGENGILQFIVFGEREVMKNRKAEVEALLSGLTIN